MKRLKHFKNKYVITSIVFVVYILFLDDVDVFTIARQEIKLNKLENERALLLDKFTETKNTLEQLDNTKALERYAREEKLFKRDNEDIFVIVKED
ncbi:septum formation initiator family protein [Brumimicrobium aurantiacum]|uniref:Septum formation initiator family protein n=1 Tax=Brumimicrobium aurantiacum TaxID=1737063 RepID=A0A3E1EXN0_9FLAO|nr:septum formation initiator family protein [Brumimicrobium aurantiacum]RFC54304.1 septum formation initiator family protein [Brumimicrobium aurantiacum]